MGYVVETRQTQRLCLMGTITERNQMSAEQQNWSKSIRRSAVPKCALKIKENAARGKCFSVTNGSVFSSHARKSTFARRKSEPQVCTCLSYWEQTMIAQWGY